MVNNCRLRKRYAVALYLTSIASHLLPHLPHHCRINTTRHSILYITAYAAAGFLK